MLRKHQHDAYIVGFYGQQNAGDDALMHSAFWGARHALGCNNVITNNAVIEKVNNASRVISTLASGQRFRGQQRLLHYFSAWRSQRIIFGGGSVLHSSSDIRLKRQLLKLSDAKLSRAVGVGIGPFQDSAAEAECQLFLNDCGFIGVRDQESFDIATSLAPKAKVALTFDLAPCLLHNVNLAADVKRQGIAINFCQTAINPFGATNSLQEQNKLERAVDTVNLLWQRTGIPITLIDFNGDERNGDHHIHNKVMKRVAKDVKISHQTYNNDTYAMLHMVRGFQLLIGMRLHAAIFAYITETPCLFIQYHSKCQGWSEQIGMTQNYQFDDTCFSPQHLTDTVIQGLNKHFIQPKLSLETAKQRALLNWS